MDEQEAAPVVTKRVGRRLVRRTLIGAICLALLGTVGAGIWLVRWRPLPGASQTPVDPLLPGAPVLTPPTPPAAATVPLVGFDVSHPQCGSPLPSAGGYAIVGLNRGRPLSSNPCAAAQLTWAKKKAGRAVYVNTGFPGTGDPITYGRKVVDDAIAREHSLGVSGIAVWWLDVETANTWAGTQRQHATVLDAMAARLQSLGVRVGIYSTPAAWTEIAGDWNPALPIWFATGPGTQAAAATSCSRGFAGSQAAIVQWVENTANGELDHNLICPAYAKRAAELLDLS